MFHSLFTEKGSSGKGLILNCDKFILLHKVCDTDCFLFARTQLKQKGFFASNGKYVVCFNKFYTGKGFCVIFRPSCCVKPGFH